MRRHRHDRAARHVHPGAPWVTQTYEIHQAVGSFRDAEQGYLVQQRDCSHVFPLGLPLMLDRPLKTVNAVGKRLYATLSDSGGTLFLE